MSNRENCSNKFVVTICAWPSCNYDAVVERAMGNASIYPKDYRGLCKGHKKESDTLTQEQFRLVPWQPRRTRRIHRNNAFIA